MNDTFRELIETSEKAVLVKRWLSDHLEGLQTMGAAFPGGLTAFRMQSRYDTETGEVVGCQLIINLGQFPYERKMK